MFLTLTRITVALTLLMTPASAAAGTLRADDSVAGVGIDVTLAGFAPHTQIAVGMTPPDGNARTFTVRSDAAGGAVLSVPGRSAERAGIYAFSAGNATAQARIDPDSLDPWMSSLQVKTAQIRADGRETAGITVTLRDRYGNPLPGRTAGVLSGRTGDAIRALTPETDAAGVQSFALLTTTPGEISLRAIDLLSGTPLAGSAVVQAGGTAMGGQATAYGSPYAAQLTPDGRFFYAQTLPSFDVIDRFEVEAPATMQPGVEAPKITIRAVDRSGRTVENYLGTVVFSSTDPQATLPNFGSYTFRDRDLGEKSFALALTFRTGGPQTMRVEDRNDNRIAGEATIQVSGGGVGPATGSIQITSHANDGYINSTDIVVEGRGPRFANLIVMGGPQDAVGSSDENGFFSIPVRLNPAQRDHTIRVRDESGRNDSGPLRLVLDQSIKEIDTIRFAPERPSANEQVLAAVQSAPGMAQVLLRLPDGTGVQEIVLTENPQLPGMYQGFFTAPAPGSYQPSVVATDRAGNRSEVRTLLTVASHTLPRVTNLRLESRAEAVALQWDAVEGDVSAYRIYIGNEPENFVYTLDTGGAVTQAVVRGLLPGRLYHFAVTALRGDRESEERSEPVAGQTLGITLDVTPAENALQVRWTDLAAALPLSSFLLEYGTGPDALTEQRRLNGDLRDITLRDLLPGVVYHLRLTPVSVAGQPLAELAAVGQGTPGGAGFRASARDEVPFDVVLHPGAQLRPPPAVNDTGLPPAAWMAAASLGAAGLLWYVRRRQERHRLHAFLRSMPAPPRR